MRRETSRVSFLMCPFCVRAVMPSEATNLQAVLTVVGARSSSWRRLGGLTSGFLELARHEVGG
jgi:hypothetical protein